MTTRLAVALAATLFVAQGPSFEGTIRLRNIHVQVDEDEARTLLDAAPSALAAREDADIDSATILIKGKLLRTQGDPDAEGGYPLWDLATGVMTAVMPEEKAYIVMPVAMTGGQGRAAPPGPGGARAGPAPRTLGTRTINGMKTTGYEIRDGDLIVRGWMTMDHPGLTWAFRTAIAQQKDDAEEEDAEDKATNRLSQYGFPVLLYTVDQRGLIVEEMVAIDRGVLSADLFKVPGGYTKRTLGGP